MALFKSFSFEQLLNMVEILCEFIEIDGFEHPASAFKTYLYHQDVLNMILPHKCHIKQSNALKYMHSIIFISKI